MRDCATADTPVHTRLLSHIVPHHPLAGGGANSAQNSSYTIDCGDGDAVDVIGVCAPKVWCACVQNGERGHMDACARKL